MQRHHSFPYNHQFQGCGPRYGDGNVISDNPEATSVYSKRDEVYKVGKLPKDKDKDKDKDQNKDKSDSSDTDKKTTESESDTQEE